MKLKVVTPSEIAEYDEIGKIVAEDVMGSFCLLPDHIDFVTALVPGILAYTGNDGTEKVIAVDEGVLVKKGMEVMVSARNMVQGDGLGSLEEALDKQIGNLDEAEKKTREILVKLEAEFVKHFKELR
jgi:F-type H+-transporting ATPase subunit epsilon